LISQAAGRELGADDIQGLAAEARRLLREKFLAAGMGISGANLVVAETGSVVVVENEGNIRLVTSAPPVHVVIVGLEKVARTWDDAAVWLSLLARSATGQPLSVYTSIITGPARPEDPDGPAALHIILLDNGRSRLLGGVYEEALQCIRCGACLNICPVYRHVGGHAYGSAYSGPIGAVITPLLFGLEAYAGLPQASSLCGACLDVCPARIDLPRMLLALRAEIVACDLLPASERRAEKLAAALLLRPGIWRLTTSLGRRWQRPWLRAGQLRLPHRLNPAPGRRLPPLAARSFHALWAEELAEGKQP
jgi:L-lactate dehydrogenase complex protein LldF